MSSSPGPPFERVGAGPAVENVVSVPADQFVGAAQALDGVVELGPEIVVMAWRAKDGDRVGSGVDDPPAHRQSQGINRRRARIGQKSTKRPSASAVSEGSNWSPAVIPVSD